MNNLIENNRGYFTSKRIFSILPLLLIFVFGDADALVAFTENTESAPPTVAETARRDESRLLIQYRKRYLDDAALDHYLSGAGWANVKSEGRTAAFYYLDYTSRREFAVT
ncbi:MAG: hypothetical protein GY771_17065, partial [bacterium]|nr:hypothetical protein [bacterium]